MHTNLRTSSYLLALFTAFCMGCGGGTSNSPPSGATNVKPSELTASPQPATADSVPQTAQVATNEPAAKDAPANDNRPSPVATKSDKNVSPAKPREPALAAELLQVVDVRKLPRLNVTRMLDDSATYAYYSAQGSVASGKAFYNAELTSQGWKEVPTSMPGTAQYVDLLYEKAGYYLRVGIGSGSDEGTVGISLSSLGNYDMTALPRLDNAPKHEASTPVNVNYRTTKSIVDAAKFCSAEFAKLGWQEYTGLHDPDISVPHAKSLNFRKNAVRVMVSISRHPLTPTEVIVAYMADAALPFDLPVIASGSQLKIELHSGKAEYVAANPISEIAEFYQAPNPKLTWKLRADDTVVGENGATMFVEDGPAIGFAIQLSRKDDLTKVAFQRLSFKEKSPTDAPVAPPSDVASKVPAPKPADDPADDPVAKALKEAEAEFQNELKKLGNDLKGLGVDLPKGLPGLPGGKDNPAANKETPAPAGNVAAAPADTKPNVCRCKVFFGDKTYEMTHAIAIQKKQFDELATVIFIGEKPLKEGKLKTAKWDDLSIFDLTGFDSGSSMQVSLTEDYASINCFIDGKSISFGSGKIKQETRLNANRLVGKVYLDKPEDFFDTPFRFEVTLDVAVLKAEDRPARPASDELTANEDYELPVPEGTSGVSKEGTPYRDVIEAAIDAELAKVLKFYRAELTTRGWKEDAAKTKADTKSAQLAFTGEQGGMSLKLTREDDTTNIHLSSRKEKLAKQHGIAPQAGQGKLMLGNANEKEVVIVIGTKEYNLAAGEGADDPATAKKLDIEPGKHKITIKTPGADPETEEVDIAPDTTWGVIAFPGGGALVVQVY
jgi:hypothetical protein